MIIANTEKNSMYGKMNRSGDSVNKLNCSVREMAMTRPATRQAISIKPTTTPLHTRTKSNHATKSITPKSYR